MTCMLISNQKIKMNAIFARFFCEISVFHTLSQSSVLLTGGNVNPLYESVGENALRSTICIQIDAFIFRCFVCKISNARHLMRFHFNKMNFPFGCLEEWEEARELWFFQISHWLLLIHFRYKMIENRSAVRFFYVFLSENQANQVSALWLHTCPTKLLVSFSYKRVEKIIYQINAKIHYSFVAITMNKRVNSIKIKTFWIAYPWQTDTV